MRWASEGRGKKGVASKVARRPRGSLSAGPKSKILAKTFERMEDQSRGFRAIDSKRADGKGHRPKGIASKVAGATDLFTRRAKRILSEDKPKPAKPAKGKTFERMEGQVEHYVPPVSKLNDGRGEPVPASSVE